MKTLLLVFTCVIILDSAVRDAEAMQDFESESFRTGGEHSHTVKAPPVRSDYGSKGCVASASPTAESRITWCQAENFVTCQFMGQLGNQLFETGATLAYAWDYGATARFPGLHTSWERMDFNRDHIFFRLDTTAIEKPFTCVFKESCWESTERIPFRENQLLTGYFQSYKHFHHHRDKLLATFAPSDTDTKYLQNKYQTLLTHLCTVSIHVRTIHKAQHDSKDFPFIGLQYYANAVKLFPEDALFVVFSDRINWCKQHFPKICQNVVFIEGNDHVQDLFLMSLMKHNIIANSTFSWWGAYLNKNPDKRVVAPEHWFHPDRNKLAHPNHLYLPEWKVVPSPLGEYPADMTNYDACSQSLGQ